jgi:hypothetical protein
MLLQQHLYSSRPDQSIRSREMYYLFTIRLTCIIAAQH